MNNNQETGEITMLTKDDEEIEVEDDQRCGNCGSTEGGHCFYCQDGLG